MKKNKAKLQEYRSMVEYEKKFFPESQKEKEAQVKDTDNLGIIMARQSLSKFRQLVQRQGVCL